MIVFWVEDSIAVSQLQGPEFEPSSGYSTCSSLWSCGFPVGFSPTSQNHARAKEYTILKKQLLKMNERG